MTRFGWAVSLVALVMAALVWGHVDPISGPAYWRRPWVRLDVAGVVAMAVALAVYCVVSAWLLKRDRIPPWLGLTLLSGSLMLSMATAVMTQQKPWGTDRLAALIQSPSTTGYLSDAARAPENWLPSYHLLSPTAMMHTSTKPAGPMLFYTTILDLVGGDVRRAAIVGGFLLILISGLGVPATYWATRELAEGDHRAALMASILAAGAPGAIVFCSQFDPAYIVMAGVMVAAWARAVRTASWAWAAVAGLALGVVLFFAFQLLVLGLFMLALPFVRHGRGRMSDLLPRLALLGSVMIAVVFATHLLLYGATGYNTVAVFAVAQENQAAHLLTMPERRAPWTTGWDLYDYLLGLGWPVVVPLVTSLVVAFRQPPLRYAWLSGVQLLTIALFALLAAETARVWLFLIPITLAAAGHVASRWTFADRLCLVVVVAISALSVHANMTFMVP